MRILVIFTGGTIGSSERGGWIAPNSETDYLLLKRYRSLAGDFETEIDMLKPCNILSENLSANEINTIISCVMENLKKDYDGIIVTHGSDTIGYTAAALSYAVEGVDIPIVLVCSAYPLEDKRENGTVNFTAAVEFIKSKLGKGVFVSYKNDNKNTTDIHIATRIIQHQECSADIYSIDNQPYAYCDGKIKLNTEYKPSLARTGTGKSNYCKEPEILVIESRPCDAFNYSLDGVKAVILKPYHSGTLNTESDNLCRFCLEARERGIPVFLVNVRSGDSYESSKLFDNIGLSVLPLCSYIALYMKCWLALSLDCDIKEFLIKPIAQEFLE